MKMTKTTALFTIGASALAITAFAAPRIDDSLPELNAIVTEILAPFQTEKSSATLDFIALVSDDEKVLTVSLDAFYQRIGKVQTMNVRLNQLSHDYNNGAPKSSAYGSADFDLTQLFQQEQLDGMVEGAEQMVKDLVGNYTKPYGEAVILDAKMIDKQKDEAGHYTGFQAQVTVNFDFSKLPQDKKAEDIPVLDAVLNFDVVLNSKITVDAEVNHNPSWKGFKANDAASFKAGIEKLLARDEGAKTKISALLKKVDGMAAGLVDAKIK